MKCYLNQLLGLNSIFRMSASMSGICALLLFSVVAGGVSPLVAAEPEVQAMSVTENPILLYVGAKKKVPVKVLPAEAAKQPLQYESGNSGFFTVDESGVMTGIHEGSTALSITAPSGVQVDVQVRVEVAPEKPVVVSPKVEPVAAVAKKGDFTKGILIGNAGGAIELGRTERIVAHVLPHQAIGHNPFTISSSNPEVLRAIDEIKAVEALKEGTATITASTLDGRFKSSVTYTVVPARDFEQAASKTYRVEASRFGLRYDDASEEAAKANSAGLYKALLHTADTGNTRLLLEEGKVLYVEPKDSIYMVSNVELDLNGSEIRLRPNDYARYTAFKFAEHPDRKRVLENASIVNGTLTGERDHKEQFFPNWAKDPSTEGGVTIEFYEGRNNGIRKLTVRKSIGFNISSGVGNKAYGVEHFARYLISTRNMELGGFDDQGRPVLDESLIRLNKPVDISTWTSPYYTLGYPMGYMGYPFVNSRIYDAYFYDKDMKFLGATHGNIRYRQYAMPKGAAYMNVTFARFFHVDGYKGGVPEKGNSDFHDAVAFIDNFAMPINNYMIDCIVEDNYSCGFAACGGQGWLIKNNVFRRNGGRMPGCDIDWEDGWEYMQNDLIIGNKFESMSNVITCAGVGFVFRDNVFRGSSNFYGRTEHYSMLNNVFAQGEGEDAFPVRMTYGSQTDIYAYGNRYENAIVGYTRQHKEGTFIGTYEATFANETFINTQILRGHIARLIDCRFSGEGDYISLSAGTFENCIFASGSYSVDGKVIGSELSNVKLRVPMSGTLEILDCKLTNVSFDAAKDGNLVIDKCEITVTEDQPLIQPAPNMSSVKILNSAITVQTPTFSLVGGWNSKDTGTTIELDTVRFNLPDPFYGYLHKFAWYAGVEDEKKITYNIVNTDVSAFQMTDEKGTISNAVFRVGPER
jgi:hypothetical protein